MAEKRSLGRREFVELLGAGTAASAVTAWVPGCGDDTGGSAGGMNRVIVIGAGVAGLTIGNALTTAGVDTVVLEARDRLGGRVWSSDVGGVGVDLGGMWISGPDGNPAACVLNQEGIGWQPAEPFDLNTAGYDAVLQQELGLGDLLGAATALDEFDAATPGLLDTLGPSATYAGGIAGFLDQSGLTGDERRYAEFGLRTQAEISFGQSADLVSLASYDSSNPLPGGEHLPNGSFRGLVNALARGVDVQLGTVVSRIEYSDNGVTIETSSGIVTGSHVVVTVPLGVLKAGSIEFAPALPAEKAAAIDRLGMAELEKVVLRYDNAFWQSPGSGNFLYVSETAGEFPLFVDYTPFAGGQPTLVGFYSGDFGRSIAALSDDAIAGRASDIASELAGASGMTPIAARVTRWKSDPFAMGSYVYLPVGASQADIEALGAPLGERLLFAGEATSLLYNGYVHGAVLSGIREAERLLGREGQGVEIESGIVIQQGCDEEASAA